MSLFFNYNGRFYKEGTPVITPDNHSFKYGDGVFETLKATTGKLHLAQYHFERLLQGLKILAFNIPPGFIEVSLNEEIIRCLKKNRLTNAKIRLTVFRGDGPLNEPENHHPNYIIQIWPLDDTVKLNTKGLVIDLYLEARKSCDGLANLKTNNFLLYALAAISAKKRNLDDCIVLNSKNSICDTSVANIFIIKNGNIFTPSLTEGCIAGVMRRWIIEKITIGGNSIIERKLGIEDLIQADAVFLTNSIHPVRWVGQFKNAQYTNSQVEPIYDELVKTF